MAGSNKSDEIFSGLEHLGFDNVGDIKLFKENKTEEEIKNQIQEQSENQKSLLYDKEILCPACGSKFKVRSVKTSAARVIKKDSDFFIRHAVVDPYFYDVWLCNTCGYAAMKRDFEKLRQNQIEKVRQNISLKWKGRNYPEVYDLNIAIERYKLSLLNYWVTEAKSSSKAMNCLKLAWMYRLKEDPESEASFLKQALEGLNDAYYNEDFPIYGMDRFTTMYLIGELHRRLDDFDRAMVWFSKIITTPSVPQKLKEMSRDQKDLITQAINQKKEISEADETGNTSKRGLFSRLFK